MKWMLIVVVYGTMPVQTGLIYNSLDECLVAESAVRKEWARTYNAVPKEIRDQPDSQAFMIKQMTPGTCAPYAPLHSN